jgi:replicative DNA helicase
VAEISPVFNRQPPNDLPAEQGVLGGVLIHGSDVMAGIATSLTSEDFYDPRHALIFNAMLEIYRRNEPLDEVTVASQLSDTNRLEQAGGQEFLLELGAIVLAAGHVDHYAKKVKDKSLLRSFISATHEAVEQAHHAQADPDVALEEAEKLIFAATQQRLTQETTPLADLTYKALSLIAERIKNRHQIPGVPTGFKRLDEMTTGLQRGDLIIVAARPSMGKTAFSLNIAANCAIKDKVPTAFFSLEMSKESLAMRLLSSEAGVSGGKIRSGYLSYDRDFPALVEAASKLSEAPIYIDDTPALGVLELRAKARRLKAEKGLGIIFIDYLQLMRGRKESSDSREQEISEISRSLKALAKELDLPVVALSQLNRKVEDRPGEKIPQLSDLRESGAIEQDADVIAFIYRKKAYKKKDEPEEPDDNIAQIIIGKQRNGPTGTVKLLFLDDLTRFTDISYEEESG